MNNAKRICRAALRGDLTVVRLLLAADPSLLEGIEDHDTLWTPLVCGVFMGQEETVRFLLEQGANVNHRDGRGGTALHVACKYGRGELVGLLLDHGADLSSTGLEGLSPLAVAAISNEAAIVDHLLAHGGSDADGRDLFGRSALLLAAAEGHDAVCARLLAAGADPLIGDRRGSTALDLATRRRHRACRAVLEVRGLCVRVSVRGPLSMRVYPRVYLHCHLSSLSPPRGSCRTSHSGVGGGIPRLQKPPSPRRRVEAVRRAAALRPWQHRHINLNSNFNKPT
jgi:ankyrin repeat protein